MIPQDAVQGHWVRDWIKAPGFEDHTTRVHWIQAGATYSDIRVPIDRPDRSGARALRDLPPGDLRRLAQAEGFAGRIALQDSTCTWHREINWHGVPEAMDVGTLRFDAEGRMFEDGVHATYTELWARRPGPPATALRFGGHGLLGIAASVGEAAVVGIGRPEKPATAPLLTALESGRIPAGIEALFDGLHALGRWDGDTLVAQLATQPFAEARPVLTRRETSITWHRIGFDGARSDVVLPLERGDA